MLVWRSYQFRCPHCAKVYKRSLTPLQLGTGKRRCQHCATVFDDGSKEWPDLLPIKKFEYIFPTMTLGYFGGLAIVIGYALVIAADLRELDLMMGVLVLCMILPWLPYFLSRLSEIRRSKDRFERRAKFGMTEELILP